MYAAVDPFEYPDLLKAQRLLNTGIHEGLSTQPGAFNELELLSEILSLPHDKPMVQ
jgi:hypothetical protein